MSTQEAGPVGALPLPRGAHVPFQGAEEHIPPPTPPAKGMVISVAGVATDSALALNLAAYLGLRLRESKKLVCIVDMDFRRARLSRHFHDCVPNVGELIKDPGLLHADRIHRAMMHRTELNLSVLLAPPITFKHAPHVLSPELYERTLAVLREVYDYVIVSAPTHPCPLRDLACMEADRVLVPAVTRPDDVQRASTWARSLSASGREPSLILLQAPVGGSCRVLSPAGRLGCPGGDTFPGLLGAAQPQRGHPLNPELLRSE